PDRDGAPRRGPARRPRPVVPPPGDARRPAARDQRVPTPGRGRLLRWQGEPQYVVGPQCEPQPQARRVCDPAPAVRGEPEEDTVTLDEVRARMKAAGIEIAENRLEMVRRLLTDARSEEHTSELQSRFDLVCRLLLEQNK